jgi:hypothetical protein
LTENYGNISGKIMWRGSKKRGTAKGIENNNYMDEKKRNLVYETGSRNAKATKYFISTKLIKKAICF